jgi:hypothetical protein
MNLLFGDETYRTVGSTKPLPSAFVSLLIHGGVLTVLLAISLTPAALTIPDHFRRTMLAAPPAPPPPPAARRVRHAGSRAGGSHPAFKIRFAGG